MSAAPARDLRPLFEPRSVALVGASDESGKWGYAYSRSVLRGNGDRAVYFVNRKGGSVAGREAYRSLGDLPEPPELVLLTIPAASFEQVVDDALAAGTRAIVAVVAGLGELGEDGRRRERAAVERVREAGAVMLGPNCLGVADTHAGFDATGWLDLPSGDIALVTQSGTMGFDLSIRAREAGLGFSRFVSLGNAADVGVHELVDALVDHEPTRVIALYCEDVPDGRELVAAARRAHAAGKPVVMLAPGRSDAAVRAALSHTGALATDSAVLDAACAGGGIRRVETPGELFGVAGLLRLGHRATGGRVAIVSDGGGSAVIAADAAAAVGLTVPPLSAALERDVRGLAYALAATRNPLDLGADDWPSNARVVEMLLGSGDFDAVLLTGSFGYQSELAASANPADVAVALAPLEMEAGRTMSAAFAATRTPLAVCTTSPGSPAADVVRAAGIPVGRDVELLARALRSCAGPGELPEWLPLPAPEPVPDGANGYWAARALLGAAEIPLVPARRVRSAAQAAAAGLELGFPVVLKAATLLHKSDAGGVIVGLADEESLVEAYEEMDARLACGDYSVERMAPVAEGVETIVGCRRDPRFGPVLLAGLGGIHAEVMGDVAVALAPAGEGAAGELFASLRGAALLAGARGRPALDAGAAARCASALSALAARRPDIAEIEVNPLLVLESGAVALDARVVLA